MHFIRLEKIVYPGLITFMISLEKLFLKSPFTIVKIQSILGNKIWQNSLPYWTLYQKKVPTPRKDVPSPSPLRKKKANS